MKQITYYVANEILSNYSIYFETKVLLNLFSVLFKEEYVYENVCEI